MTLSFLSSSTIAWQITHKFSLPKIKDFLSVWFMISVLCMLYTVPINMLQASEVVHILCGVKSVSRWRTQEWTVYFNIVVAGWEVLMTVPFLIFLMLFLDTYKHLEGDDEYHKVLGMSPRELDLLFVGVLIFKFVMSCIYLYVYFIRMIKSDD